MIFNYDIVIVGAGIDGASSAIALAPEGYRILLLDQANFPRDKPCGEGIMPQGVQILDDLGVLPEILAHQGTCKARGIRYRNRQGVSAKTDFRPREGGGSFAIGIRRWYLDHLLLLRARSRANITVREGFRVTEVIQEDGLVKGVAGHSDGSSARREAFYAPLTIGADGRHSVFHKACGITKTYLRRKRFGVTGHLRNVEGVDPYIEVVIHPHGEMYIAPCGEGITLVALLVEQAFMPFFARDLPDRYHAFLRSAEGFRERAVTSEVVGRVFAIGPLGFTVEPCHRAGLLLIGDSAGFLDPITGEGITFALKSVQAAVPLIRTAYALGDFGPTLGQRYETERLRLTEDIFHFTRLLLNLSRYKPVADRAIRRLSHDEVLFQKLLGIVTGRRRYQDITLGEKASLLMGST